MLRAAIPLVVLVLLAGCLGAEPETPAAPVDASGAEATAAQDAEALENASTPAIVTPVATPVSYAGSTSASVCEFMATGTCMAVQSGTEDYHMLDVAGQAKRLALQVTYDGQLPGMDFYVGVCIGENEGSECLDYQTGPSPLVVEFDLSSYPPGTDFGISVGSLNTAATATGAMVFGPSEFQVEGTLTSLPPTA